MPSPFVLVTGATDGIGRETAEVLVRRGARVIVHGRHPLKVAKVAQALGAEGVVFDFASLDAIRVGARELAARFPRIDVLINNAGLFMNERVLTRDGFETTWQVNHLAPHLLTRLLLDGPLRGPGARVVNVASIAHTRGQIHFDDLGLAHGYGPYTAYAQSKLANVLFTRALARRHPPAELTVNALHPGVVGTKLLREGFNMEGKESLAEGAATSVHLALAPELANVTGRYFMACREVEPAPQAQSDADAERLWALTERMVGLA
jgi:NAD(P)-dependent dehydrogenase (short-subunit alcohol dehydrogenase family)